MIYFRPHCVLAIHNLRLRIGGGVLNSAYQYRSDVNISNRFNTFEDEHISSPDKRRTKPDQFLLQGSKPLLKERLKRKLKSIEPAVSRLSQPESVREKEILFGLHPVTIALQQDRRKFHKLFLKNVKDENERRFEIECLAEAKNIPVEYVHRSKLDQIADRPVHQGVCADVSGLGITMYSEVQKSRKLSHTSKSVWLVLENVQDPMNFGAILRTSYFLGVEQIFCSSQNSCRLSPVVSKASSGVLELLNILALDNIVEFLEEKREDGWCVVGTGRSMEFKSKMMSITEFIPTLEPTIVVLGNEGVGLPERILNVCRHIISIEPGGRLHPSVDSLNVSVATGILIQNIISKKKMICT